MLLTRFGRSISALVATLALTWLTPCAAFAAPPAPRAPKHEEAPVRVIAIIVNGEELSADPAPRVVDGRLLVPVVRIYSALGIGVTREGNDLTASAPGKRIVVRAGSSRATIDDRIVEMEAPATEIDGATYVPLRFVADSLGAQVSYDAKGQQVDIISTVVGRTPGLERHTISGSTDIVGEISAIDLDSAPESITVTRGPSERTISITSDARILVQDVTTRTEAKAAMNDLHVGDAVDVLLRKDGTVDSVTARYSSHAGTIAATSSSQFVLQSGYVVTPGKATTITLNGQPVTVADLKVGDAVTVRQNPDTGEKREIIASRAVSATPAPAGTVQIAALNVDARTPLRAGESFTVTLQGTPGGQASFDIGTYVTGVPMTESAPGTYRARYTVPQGVNFGRTTVYGHLDVNGTSAPRAQAPQLVAITTTPPQILAVAPGNGAVVNSDRPSVYATFSSPTDVGINPGSARIELNGLDVTASAFRTDGFITYMPSVALPDGTVSVIITVADNAGNTATRRFSFTVRAH